jgi:hypothetical protein
MRSATMRLIIAAAALAFAPDAFAHHSTAMYDVSKRVTVSGTVTEVRWTNPHVVYLVQVDDSAGRGPVVWTVETTSPSNLIRSGWTRSSIKVGQRVAFDVAPLRDGGSAGVVRGSTKVLSTGQVLE